MRNLNPTLNAALEADASRIATMVDKFTIEAAPETEPVSEPAP